VKGGREAREGFMSAMESKDRPRHTYKTMATSIRTSSIMHRGINAKALLIFYAILIRVETDQAVLHASFNHE